MIYTRRVTIDKIKEENRETLEDLVIVEYPFTIFLNDEEFITLLCSPRNLDYLAVGFLVSEGIIKTKEEIESIYIDEEKGHGYIALKGKRLLADKLYGKRTVTTGCGKGTVFYNVLDSIGAQPINHLLEVTTEEILSLSRQFNEASDLFKETGGVHACGLCSRDEILLFHEDVGRHNALDKIIGEAFLKNMDLEDKILITTGRISSEMIIKTSKRKIPVIISRSAPTDLSINIAKSLNIVLIGFARGRRLNIYNGEKSIPIT
ncbi:formate dehydrogenase accessory sulfurtransferase FdhD [Clostridium formicaceticum]|uniref:Sulfur carrier protein FdhD n=1 Tax=Clostridium formicaceticum TaxID=1497 RepID=A0AAC9RL90_9CLOT|nr:formate dehydrogenase accessory sulfurtransferase FdhD [Clostridium formicaceticum]AOY74788.1 sufurtransferase FdhD [Clostridium formicaceticum]ARE89179.1 formate dehydrogenase accessory protein [Clostridium formicaceticum]